MAYQIEDNYLHGCVKIIKAAYIPVSNIQAVIIYLLCGISPRVPFVKQEKTNHKEIIVFG